MSLMDLALLTNGLFMTLVVALVLYVGVLAAIGWIRRMVRRWFRPKEMQHDNST